jgi:zinc transport system permease protein
MSELLEGLLSPLAQGFVRRALGAGLTLGATGALLGVFIVQRGLGLLSDGLAHATFGGLALGLLLGATVDRAIWVALPFTVAIALGIQYVRRRTTLGGDVATGVFFAVSFAAGILFLGLRPARSAPVNVEGLLFGSLLAVSPEALYVILGVAALVAVVLAVVGPRLAYATFDPELATLSGVKVASLEYLLLALTALVVVVGVKTVGVVLVSAFVVIPAATASLVGRTLGGIALLAVALSVAGTAFGLFASYHLNVATGATIILTLGAMFFLALVLRRRCGRSARPTRPGPDSPRWWSRSPSSPPRLLPVPTCPGATRASSPCGRSDSPRGSTSSSSTSTSAASARSCTGPRARGAASATSCGWTPAASAPPAPTAAASSGTPTWWPRPDPPRRPRRSTRSTAAISRSATTGR